MKIILLFIFCLLPLPGLSQEEVSSQFNAQEELRKLGYETVTAASLMDDKVVVIVKKLMKENPLKNQELEEVQNIILNRAEGKPLEGFLRNNPRVLAVTADIVRDEEALPSLVNILLKREALKRFFFIWIGILISVWLIKKFWIKKNKNLSKIRVFFGGLIVSSLGTALSILIFYNIFYDELSPTIKIIINHW